MTKKKVTDSIAREVALNAFIGVTEAPEMRAVHPDTIKRVARLATTQDPWWASKRVHASVAAGVVVLLGTVGVDWHEAQVVEYLGAASAIAAVLLPLLSKRQDVRATR